MEEKAAEYEEIAETLERRLQEEAPLLRWRTFRPAAFKDAEEAAHYTDNYSIFFIVARLEMANWPTITVKRLLDREFVHHFAGSYTRTVREEVARTIAAKLAGLEGEALTAPLPPWPGLGSKAP